ncbi:2-hydroxyacid dehydrogenase [Noviherbaspirillum massiliense]|uniref:2-hydroxyacid dehydrogenase n=1 Tax=Noviherbaspirillum massiliense TaxID=1465823 RepID=UPI000300D475|nr:2-hydroxyacid dehydrogenase [Noviherbaspirillum massiliense]
MKPRLLQHGRLLSSLEAAIAAEFDVHPLWKEADPQAFLARHGSEFSGLVTSARVGADAALIEALPALKVIASFGVGYETLDLESARRRGVVVSNTPDVLNDCVADLAFGLLIDVARGISAADRFVRRGDWERGIFPLTTRVSGKRLGILGLGRIGQTIARRSAGFEMDVRYHSRRPVPDVPWTYEASAASLAEWADFLVVACAGGAATRHLVSAEVLQSLGPDGFLINIARGSVVDERALVSALSERRIAGAALDVFENEPQVPQELLALDNVVLLPHIASGTRETRQAMADLVLANLRSYFTKGRLETPIA